MFSRFRRAFRDCPTTRADALFELTDAVLRADGPIVLAVAGYGYLGTAAALSGPAGAQPVAPRPRRSRHCSHIVALSVPRYASPPSPGAYAA